MQELTQAKKESLMKRIRALLKFDAENTTEEEAAAALAKAQELLLQYNIDLAEIQSEQEKPKMSVLDYELPTARMWAKSLLASIAECNFCIVSWMRGTNKAKLIGSETNLEVVTLLFERIAAAAVIMAAKYRSEYIVRCNDYFVTPLHGSAYNSRFYQGLADAIYVRLKEQQEKASEKGRALIVVTEIELKLYQEEILGRKPTPSKSIKRRLDGGIYYQGVQAGKDIEINPLLAE